MRITQAESYIQGFEEAMKMLPNDGVNGGSAVKTLRPGTKVARAREVLAKAGTPLHVNEILKAMGESQDRNNRTGLSGSIAAYVRQGEVFTRPAPNTFGLVEFASEPANDEPPADFGRE